MSSENEDIDRMREENYVQVYLGLTCCTSEYEDMLIDTVTRYELKESPVTKIMCENNINKEDIELNKNE